jgi:YVTN family beta-propeller protein
LLAATTIEIGCGNVYRPVASPLPATTGNPAGAETEVVLSCCLDPHSQNAIGPNPSSVLTAVNVSGDTNMSNKVIANVAGNGFLPVAASSAPMAFDYARTTIFTANPVNPPNPANPTNPTNPTDSVTQLQLSASTAGFSANTMTVALEPGSKPVSMAFQYFGSTYTQDYVVNSGTTPTCPVTGSLGVLAQPTAQLKATACVGPTPVSAWIYKDQSKVFVLDSNGLVYVVSATTFQVTNTITVGLAPIKAAQSNDGNYIYVLNSGDGSISIIDGQTETPVNTVYPEATTTHPNSACGTICASPLIDITQDTNFNDLTANTQINHVWFLHANGTVSVFDGTVPGELTWITSLSTIGPSMPSNAFPTNLALMRDGTGAYVGVGNTDKIVGINTSALATGAVTLNATTNITVGVHRSISQTIKGKNVVVETTTPIVNSVAVSRGGNSADLSKAYATTTTTTTYHYFDANGTLLNSTTYPNLYNGTAVVTAAGNGSMPINTYVTTIAAPSVVTYCIPDPAAFDGQKSCPAQIPVMVLGRS